MTKQFARDLAVGDWFYFAAEWYANTDDLFEVASVDESAPDRFNFMLLDEEACSLELIGVAGDEPITFSPSIRMLLDLTED